ncbi:zinc finger CCCH domain-containing protein 53-like isoform X1 [Juglans microcarpa x Juglans regia]|uniref:zinc finger CCCH domain-containing protein 53-like isoform X1 n=1 Tax=Juglans microcarpa x Juglans regia TaxID=2249226 RepID=UPI001B7F282E|nr:zinc finger CCCH domain-containing protein 53-like isoform X1 [Juglans microcarpa x Juglans regia]XP_040991717.1 zinc finger CCCH domain-containing protein 53-like isoform X1 [Juglans microcarpa x Juglans regia]XP_040991718.1 zinc finger CCCH domain-containing protein 53-like isoform X1 [Juglans microcarpa x Juglans regia]
MDGYEATKIVFSRIQNLDPENASKIMGLLLIQDHGGKEMIRLAFGPEALVQSVILKARKDLGLTSNPPSAPSTPSSPSPFLSSNQLSVSRQSSSPTRLLGGINLPPPPLTIPNTSSVSSASWSALSEVQNPDDLISPNNLTVGSFSSSSMNTSASSLPFYGSGATDMIDDFQLQDQLSFLNDGSPALGPKNQDLFYPQSDFSSSPTGAGGDPMHFASYGSWGGSPHRRSFSVSDVCLGSEDPNSGFGWKPCLYFARGYCKNGTSCRFLHGGLGDSVDGSAMVGSPSKIDMMDQCHEILRSKSAQQQRLAAASHLMASASFPYSSKGMNMLLQQQQQNDANRAAAALMMSEDMHKFGRSRLERNDFSMNGGAGMVNPASRQIYLTFPADSTFREEDVSNYFSIFGPVQDVRIPYQQKRMFGFVTFVYPETVKLILAKGNPHFVCDARVLVKPYKEKGKVPDKYSCRKQQHQQVERGEFSPCGTPTGVDGRDPYDLQLGARMFYTAQDMLWRRKLEEQADLQQALELQSRRLMGLQLLDIKKQHHHRALSTGSPVPSPTHSPNPFSQNPVLPSFSSSQEVPEENSSSATPTASAAVCTNLQQLQKIELTTVAGKELTDNNESANGVGNGKRSPPHEESDLQECLEHNLPDSPFASPTKAAADFMSAFANGSSVVNDADASASSADNKLATATILPPAAAATTLDMAAFKSFNCQMPRFSSGHGAIGMYAGTGGPIGI